ncbi:terminase large subunit [Paracraurococcus ruber]|uniref:Terminase n=1 Tax=Paracraurococcus ruber TaxID=77675 RepID=A0ABS1CR64_9PROT|nr:terminase TerL endonuclease subunit [Paracraurococcus ruber]MBK1656853.1 terminase [Paracraurococcus ruber]TDG33968.1 terminase large subunit [Paracraurococcus ruber]
MTVWQFAVPDWWERLQAGRSLLPDLPLDHAQAAVAVDIFNRIRLPDVEGQPPLAEAAGEWFRDVVRVIFGSRDPETGLRRVPGVFLEVPKKNSKTTNSAALMLTALLMNVRPNAQFGLFGPTQEIADLAFSAAAKMIEATPDYSSVFDVKDYNKTIVMKAGKGKGSWLKITTFDMQTATGGKYAGWLLDELHLLGKVHYASRVLGQLRGAASAIPEQFGVIISTQSDEPPAGAFKEELTYARAVRDGRVPRPSVLPMLYEFPRQVQADEAKPWRDPATWPAVLPNLGRSVSLDVLLRDYETAREKGEAEERRWASQHLNLEIGLALHADAWAGAEHWAPNAEPGLTLDALLARCEVATIGIDGGGLDDLFGLAVVGRETGTRRWLHWGRAWAHPIVLQRRKAEAARLRDFAQDGDLMLVERMGDDLAGVVEVVRAVRDAGLLPEKHAVGLDPAGIGAVLDALAEIGIEGEQVAGVSQGWRLNGAIKTTERRLAEGEMRHAGQPLMAWSVGNAKAEPKGNAVSITKQAAGSAKIDPLIALFCAVELMARNPVARSGADQVFV